MKNRAAAVRLGSALAGLLVLGAPAWNPAWSSEADAGADKVMSYTGDIAAAAGWTIVDTRPTEKCEKGSLAGARCLPAGDFLGPYDRLASFADVAWVLGSAGLDGSERVLVVGDNATDRDFVAGLMYVMGQSGVRVLTRPVSRAISQEGVETGSPDTRAMTREKVYVAPVRDKAVIFGRDLARRIAGGEAPTILDGRSEAEYWGRDVRGARGGHVPGADLLSAVSLRGAIIRGERPGPARGPVVVYGRGVRDGFAYLTLVRAGLGLEAALYPGGWREWAAAGEWPADAATYPERTPVVRAERPAAVFPWPVVFAATAVVAIVGMGLGFAIGRKRTAA